MFSASYDDTIKCWAYDDGFDNWDCIYTMEGHTSTVWCKKNLIKLAIEIDFDQTGQYLVSCGDDKSWMIWEVDETSFKHKGIIPGMHSRTIYSCSWAKQPVYTLPGAD